MCAPESVNTMLDDSPTDNVNDASSKAFCILPRPKTPRSPPFFAELQSECSIAAAWNCFLRSAGSLCRDNCARSVDKNCSASATEHVMLGSRHEDGRREAECLR